MIAGLANRIRRTQRRLVSRKLLNVADVQVSYQKPVTGSAAIDPALEATTPTTETITATHPAFVHFVEPVKTMSRQFTELEVGDAIIDFMDDVELPRSNCKFVINGETYVQKEVGNELAQYWDVMCEGQKLFRTVVATKKPGAAPTV